jgi:hypothetical protein
MHLLRQFMGNLPILKPHVFENLKPILAANATRKLVHDNRLVQD